MATKRSVILRGDPEINEYGKATAQVKPGYLVKGVTSLSHQTVTVKCARAVALERDEFGVGIDDTRQGSGTISAYYASGDRVKVAVFQSGDEATMFIASGQNLTEDDMLASAGDGTLAKDSSPFAASIARSLETTGAITATTAVRVQFV